MTLGLSRGLVPASTPNANCGLIGAMYSKCIPLFVTYAQTFNPIILYFYI